MQQELKQSKQSNPPIAQTTSEQEEEKRRELALQNAKHRKDKANALKQAMHDFLSKTSKPLHYTLQCLQQRMDYDLKFCRTSVPATGVRRV